MSTYISYHWKLVGSRKKLQQLIGNGISLETGEKLKWRVFGGKCNKNHWLRPIAKSE